MFAFLAKLGGWALKVPVLFAHFPGPSLILLVAALLSAGVVSSCVTHQLEAGARAKLEIKVAQCEAGHAKAVADAAGRRTDAMTEGARRQAEAAAEREKRWLEQLATFHDDRGAAAAIANLEKAIKELHHDPSFGCRLLPLPYGYVNGMRIPAEKPAATRRP